MRSRLGDGRLYIGLGRGQGRDLVGGGLLLGEGGAYLRGGGDAGLGVVRRLLVGDERGRGFLCAEERRVNGNKSAGGNSQ